MGDELVPSVRNTDSILTIDEGKIDGFRYDLAAISTPPPLILGLVKSDLSQRKILKPIRPSSESSMSGDKLVSVRMIIS